MIPAKLIKKIRNRKGFTLVEVVIATTIFTFVGVIAVTVFVNVLRIQHRITLENAIFEDGRFLMERISREIRQNTIDYEEYYNRDYIASPSNGDSTYGRYYGCYGQQFINPGSGGPFGGFGYNCTSGYGSPPDCTVVDKTSLDINTGENPYAGKTGGVSTNANAVCDIDEHGDSDCSAGVDSSFLQRELYLINAAGNQKTIFAKKEVDGEFAVAMVRLDGLDSDTDGITEDWIDASGKYRCADGFACGGLSYDGGGGLPTLEETLSGSGELYEGFIPLTPLRTTVTELRFYISPLEDPRKAFAETDVGDGIQQQPHVTVVMSLQPSASELSDYAGDPPTITLQTTVTSRVYNEVKSFLGKDVCGP